LPAIGDTASRSELMQLRKELADLRKAAGLPAPVVDQPHKEVYASATLIESMDRLHGVLDKLVSLFENANKEVYHDYNKGLQDTDEKLNRLIAQNEKIARGVVALADAVAQKRESVPQSVVPTAPKIVAVAPPAADPDDTPIPPPPRFNPSAPDNGTASWQPAAPQVAFAPKPQAEEESFLRQPITTISATQPARSVLPPITQPSLPQLSPPPPMMAPPLSAPPTLEAQPSLPTLAPLKLAGNDLPPPPPPPAAAASRRNLLDKFAFK
jgi:hypothetical protein